MSNDRRTKGRRPSLNPEVVPETLRRRRQWVCWRVERRKGKPTKVPIDPTTGKRASSTDSRTWASFDEARAATAARGYDGVGFVFSDQDPFTGVDLDDCIGDDGTMTDEALALLRRFNSYSEVSPSGRGVKVFIEAKKPDWAGCRTSRLRGMKQIEVYDQKRYFTVTGQRVGECSAEVEPRQAELKALCKDLWSSAASKSGARNRSQGGRTEVGPLLVAADRSPPVQKLEILRQTSVEFPATWAGNRPDLADQSPSGYDMALANIFVNAGWTDQETVDGLIAWRRERGHPPKLRPDYYRRTIGKARANSTSPEGATPALANTKRDSRLPTVRLGVDEHRAIDESVEALRADPTLYQRGNKLVRVLRNAEAGGRVNRPKGSPQITEVPVANLQDRLTAHARIHNGTRYVHPTRWLVSGVHQRGEWAGIRPLVGLSEAPVLRPDGSIWQQPGHDEATGILYEPLVSFPPLPARRKQKDAQRAMTTLLEVVDDFPFEAEAHRSAWVAALLTPLARCAFGGPAPIFLMDANASGAGKGLLVAVIGRVVSGRDVPVSTYVPEVEEMRKRLTASVIAGDQLLLLDNIDCAFGNAALDSATTSTVWHDRVLGHSERVQLPFMVTIYATGNNVAVRGDTVRRVVPIRLDVASERPEERSGFKHPELLRWVSQERGRLLVAAPTILSGYLTSGTTRPKLPAFGSFEGWSVIREAIVWAGLPDPYEARAYLDVVGSDDRDAAQELVRAWREYLGGKPVTIASLVSRLYDPDGEAPSNEPASQAMRDALEAFAGPFGNARSFTRRIGNRLKRIRGTMIGGSWLDVDRGQYDRRGAVWRLSFP